MCVNPAKTLLPSLIQILDTRCPFAATARFFGVFKIIHFLRKLLFVKKKSASFNAMISRGEGKASVGGEL